MAHETFPEWLAREERKADRTPLRLSGTANGVRTPQQCVEMTDLSPLGCRVRVAQAMTVGSYITLTSGSAPRLEGWVAWANASECGIDFVQPVPEPVVVEIANRAG